jgi:hypothetical protein
MDLFIKPTPKQEAELRTWARENYKRLQPIKGTWHPVAQAECVKMNSEEQI